MARAICVIAQEIRKEWPKVSPYAKPYLDAMFNIESIDEMYYADSAKSVVLYFLSNAHGWRGEAAKRIKAELKAMAE